MTVRKIVPPITCAAILPGFRFADCYAAPVPPGTDAVEVARRCFERPPKWVAGLLAARNWLVGWLGLKTARAIAGFPVVSRSPDLVCLGFDDSHLDFRIVVTAMPGRTAANEATLTTIVRTHNLLGRVYLFVIMPFHILIARHMLARVQWT